MDDDDDDDLIGYTIVDSQGQSRETGGSGTATAGPLRPPRRLPPHLNKFELAKVVGMRAVQIRCVHDVHGVHGVHGVQDVQCSEEASRCLLPCRADGQALVPLNGQTDPIEIAMMELRAKKINFVIRRKLPDGTFEDWRVDEMTFMDSR